MTASGENAKKRLDLVMVERGLAESRTKAQAMVMAGQVSVNGKLVTKAGSPVKPDDEIALKEQNPYVSRGGLKLESALRNLSVSPQGKVCLDVGASTGGFTDCLLQHGAVKVYAIDVGKSQLHYRLRNDPRVINIEGVNFRYFSCENLKEKAEFVTIDVSFISLEKILPVVVNCMVPSGELLALVKPQFEAGPRDVKKGVVRDETVRRAVIERVKSFAVGLGLELIGEVDSEVKGPEGNIEHFLYLKKAG